MFQSASLIVKIPQKSTAGQILSCYATCVYVIPWFSYDFLIIPPLCLYMFLWFSHYIIPPFSHVIPPLMWSHFVTGFGEIPMISVTRTASKRSNHRTSRDVDPLWITMVNPINQLALTPFLDNNDNRKSSKKVIEGDYSHHLIVIWWDVW